MSLQNGIICNKSGVHYYLEGKEVSEAAYREAYPPRDHATVFLSQTPSHLSEGLAVHPRQVQEATQDAQYRGVPTEFRPDGRPVMRSRAHQKAYLRAYGFHNRDGGYGD
jgi:hypothetical protein